MQPCLCLDLRDGTAQHGEHTHKPEGSMIKGKNGANLAGKHGYEKSLTNYLTNYQRIKSLTHRLRANEHFCLKSLRMSEIDHALLPENRTKVKDIHFLGIMWEIQKGDDKSCPLLGEHTLASVFNRHIHRKPTHCNMQNSSTGNSLLHSGVARQQPLLLRPLITGYLNNGFDGQMQNRSSIPVRNVTQSDNHS